MTLAQAIPPSQAQAWNGASGRAWVDAQTVLDAMFQPFEDHLVEAARALSARDVLDIGCGTGSTTLAIARALGDAGRCVGIDVSTPMIARAEQRAKHADTHARFVCADAERFPFAPARFDLLVSRFGVMFFADPVRAFANLRQAAREGGALHAIAWRGAADNPFMTTAERAAAALLPALPARVPGAPGQFAFADAAHVRRVLADSGWSDIAIASLDVACSLPEAMLGSYVTRMGPVGLALQDADAATRAVVEDTLRGAFAPYVQGAQACFNAACWRITARA
jgi:SAM-dependent methyltransferase